MCIANVGDKFIRREEKNKKTEKVSISSGRFSGSSVKSHHASTCYKSPPIRWLALATATVALRNARHCSRSLRGEIPKRARVGKWKSDCTITYVSERFRWGLEASALLANISLKSSALPNGLGPDAWFRLAEPGEFEPCDDLDPLLDPDSSSSYR